MPDSRSAPLSPDDWDRLAERFESAREASDRERERLVAELEAERPDLAIELRAMLAAAARPDRLEVEDRFLGWSEGALPAGSAIGAYRILRRLAKGGMGEVYLAERVDGSYSQLVAIKLLRSGFESAEMLERFRLERDLLARLTHPSVVPLLDGGAAPDGRPFLVLQYVEGKPITEYCAGGSLDPRRRAGLFLDLCRAVQFAHTHLVVHRDLKPSNILVTATGDLRLLDFGIAKLLGERPESETTHAAGNAPMTPARAAPEQVRSEPVSTATDVWALGLLLHELMTGSLPPAAEGATDGARAISAGGGALDSDLAAIARQALEPRPEDRYSSAGEMGEDVRRWLRGAPVRARPDSLAYRTLRFVRRHRASVTAGVAAVLALTTLAVFSTVQSFRIRAERDRATAEKAKAGAVVDLLVQTFGSTDPLVAIGDDATRIEDLLDLAEQRAGLLDGQPEVQALLRAVLGRVRLERGEFERARVLLQAARDTELRLFGPADPRTVATRCDLARVLHAVGDATAAQEDLRSCRRILEESAAPDRALLARVYYGLGAFDPRAEGLALVRRAVELARVEPTFSRVDVADFLSALGVRLVMAKQEEEAVSVFQEALELTTAALGPEDPRSLALRSNLSRSIPEPGRRLAEQRSILDSRIGRLGDDAAQVATSWLALGATLGELGRHAESIAAYERAVEIRSRRAGPAHPVTLAALRDLARATARGGDRGRAIQLYRDLEEAWAAAGDRAHLLQSIREERAALDGSDSGASGPP